MTRPSHFRPSERSLWLSELSFALEEAMSVMSEIDGDELNAVEISFLRSRIAAIRSEVDQMRRGRLAMLRPMSMRDAG